MAATVSPNAGGKFPKITRHASPTDPPATVIFTRYTLHQIRVLRFARAHR